MDDKCLLFIATDKANIHLIKFNQSFNESTKINLINTIVIKN